MAKKRLTDILKLIRKKSGRNTPGNNGWDLQMPKFSLGVEPLGKKSRWSILRFDRFRQRFEQKRRIQRESFVSPVRMKELRRKARPYILATCALVLFFAADGPMRIGYLLKDISMFKVRNVSITGCRSVPVKDIAALTGITQYKSSLLELDTAAIEKRIENEEWVRKAQVKRNWPSEIEIEITEHRPVALVNKHSIDAPELFYIDRNGETFMHVGPGEDVDYPVITGLYDVADKIERTVIFTEIMTFLKKAGRNNPNLPEQSVSEIHINKYGEMVIYLVDHPFPIFFGKGETVTKFYRLLRVMESLYREKESEALLSGVAYIRMDYFNDKVLVAQSGSG